MQRNDTGKSSLLRERLIYQYVTALDEGDLESLTPVLEAAIDDPELEQAIADINIAYQEEEHLTFTTTDAELVRQLLRKHLSSAFEEQISNTTPLTTSDVAHSLKDDPKVLSIDKPALERLQKISVTLPTTLGLPSLKQLAKDIEIEASDRFWQLFRQKAIFMRMGRSHEKAKNQTQLAAAREAVAKRNAKKKHKPNS
ncbi:hypothetical protein H6G00_33260 [Leptolyngbya sp. FACHB-541]|uniref:hypothetical protein n=1 Tax=Leptolyngbya sp. FACHB-541 TaxID=2692810 RepID=UPI001683AE3A|nr:hypothetical protein [Leptolyngbya sp. FACHB-541]MBD2001410.1 hypothetical protein [Leptolyngbya sp. FACHB-541]